MNLLLVDDERFALAELKEAVTDVVPEAKCYTADNHIDALRLANSHQIDTAFLDIEMPAMNGLELCKNLKDINPNINVIFVTAFTEYAVEAFQMYVSGYLLKPVTKDAVEKAMQNLRHGMEHDESKMRVQCFGNFEVFLNGKPMEFGRARTKEVFAYLVDRKGAGINTDEICAAIWEDVEDEEANKHYFRNLIADLKHTLKENGLEDVFIHKRNMFAVDTSKMDCDYYRFLKRDPSAINAYHGEYMSQYSWAELTLGQLERNIG